MLQIDGLIKRFGGIIATDQLALRIEDGECHALIGPNGAGKTTLVAQLTGELRPDSGRISFCGQSITNLSTPKRTKLGLARSFQITSVFLDFTVRENVMMAVQAKAGHSFRFWRSAQSDPTLIEPAEVVLAQVGLLERSHVLAATLSHGERRQLEIAMALATRPRMLILDEPMAGMGPDESARMVETLRQLRSQLTILLIEHDMEAVFALADRITVLVYGRAIATGSPADIRQNAQVRQAYLGDSLKV